MRCPTRFQSQTAWFNMAQPQWARWCRPVLKRGKLDFRVATGFVYGNTVIQNLKQGLWNQSFMFSRRQLARSHDTLS